MKSARTLSFAVVVDVLVGFLFYPFTSPACV